MKEETFCVCGEYFLNIYHFREEESILNYVTREEGEFNIKLSKIWQKNL